MGRTCYARSVRIGLAPWLLLASITASCVETRGSAWMRTPLETDERTPKGFLAEGPRNAATSAGTPAAVRSRSIGEPPPVAVADPEGQAPAPGAPASRGRPLGVFRNTYYSFPSADDYSGPQVQLFDASCKPIASVPQTFHDAVCVQGSGRIGAQTVSYARRDCSCARVCPRSQQQICFEALDPSRFPWGRGAAGQPIHPLRTVAVDTRVIPLGTSLYIPAFAGLPAGGSAPHDGCFRAQDRGLKIVGAQIDVFVGDEPMLRAWNARVPTASGVEVFVDERCAAASGTSP
jgi:3D (Asp-Asp-Asp) domain-containing protein